MIEFRALGSVELVGPEGADTRAVLARPKLLGLLSFLTVGASRGFHRRDSLIGVFWAELDQARARSAVRQSLYRLRQFLGEGVIETRGDDEVAVSERVFRCDVRAFEDALQRGERDTALGLYRGDLLAGFYVPDAPEFERWIDQRRKELRQLASNAAWEVADQEAARRMTQAAGQWSRRARELAPLDERLLRRVITLLDRLGDRAGAVREYETFARRMADELELEPSPETRALVERVRERGEVVAEGAPVSPPAIDGSPVGSSIPAFPQSAREARLARSVADRYRLEREIGVGGMATVYLARDLRHERDVAIKVLHPELAEHLGPARFLREIKIAANLTHPHIVPVYDSGSADGQLYYVMPHIDGESLRDRLDREGQLGLDEALGIAGDVGEALAHAHGQGVVHRDIKPENILLSGGHALVADFGIARSPSFASESRLTTAGMALGTPLYMSPEQCADSGEIDGRSDVYSLGCVLYEMLGGEPPFTGPIAEVIVRQHVNSAPRPIVDLRPSVPRNVSAVIAKALAKTPADRFRTASDFVAALARNAAGPGARLLQAPRRIAVLVAVPAALVLIAAIILGLSRNGTNETPTLDRNRVVVVPLHNRTGDTDLALLGNLAADWIAQGLREIEVIDVVPTATAINPGPDVANTAETSESTAARLAGEATGAGTVVAGAYYRRGDSLEFQVQVIDAVEERLLRAVAPVTGPLAVSGTILDSLRRRVAATVAAALDRRLMASSAASPPPSLEAYRAYLEGHRAFYHGVPLRMRETLEFMYQAVALDSTFADPRFFLVLAHANLGEHRAADSNAQLLVPFRSRFSPYQRAFLDWLIAGLRGDRVAALQAARARGSAVDIAVEALKSNRPYESIEILSETDDLSTFYFQWQTLMEALHMVGDYSRELIQTRHARDVYPDRLMMLGNELRALAALGRLDEVKRGLDESLLLPPEGGIVAVGVMGDVAAELRAHGFRDASLTVAERAVRWFHSRPSEEAATIRSKAGLAMTLYLAERWDEARALFQEVASAAPGDVTIQGYLGLLAARRGDREEALRISGQLQGMADPYDFGRDIYLQACIAAQLGDLDRAMVLLREAYARGRPFGILLHRDLDLEPLRDYPPFQEFIKPKG
jgi:DNA-binding SARP family transcriptional activator/tetratricopeptide (TPR) repeat protein